MSNNSYDQQRSRFEDIINAVTEDLSVELTLDDVGIIAEAVTQQFAFEMAEMLVGDEDA